MPLVAKWFQQIGDIKGLASVLILSLAPVDVQVNPMIASTRSHPSMDCPNYAIDLGEDEEEDKFHQAKLT